MIYMYSIHACTHMDTHLYTCMAPGFNKILLGQTSFASPLALCYIKQVVQCTLGPCQGGGGVPWPCLNFKTSRVGVYKCLSLMVGFAITVAIWPRRVVSCRDFILRAVATFWAMSLVGIYPGRAFTLYCTFIFLTLQTLYTNSLKL